MPNQCSQQTKPPVTVRACARPAPAVFAAEAGCQGCNAVSATVLLIGLLVLCPLCAADARVAMAAPSEEAEWLVVGVGAGTGAAAVSNVIFDDAAFMLGGGVLRRSHIWSFRYTRVGTNGSIGDVAVLYDRVLARAPLLVSAGIGAGLLYRDSAGATSCCGGESDSAYGMFDEVGLSWWAQAASDRRSGFNAGACLFGSVGGGRDFWGIALVARIGRLSDD